MNAAFWRYKQFHPSYLLGWFCVGMLGGLVIGRSAGIEFTAMWLMACFALTLGAFHSRRWWAAGLIIASGFLLGSMRGGVVSSEYGAYKKHIEQTTILTGVLSGDPQKTASGRIKLTVTRVQIDRRAYPGEVFATMYGSADLKRGDQVTFSGKLREGFASYGAALSAAHVLEVKRGNDLIRDVRERFAAAVRSVAIEPIASLGLGFVVGQRSALPDTLDEQLKVVGLTHIVVASGYNLTILVRFVMRLLSRQSRYLAFVGSLLLIMMFVSFSGLSPSMTRAVIVTVLGLLAWYVGRRFHPVLLLLYVAAATAFLNPMYVWSDLGWYLSFFAFAGILIVSPLVLRRIYTRREPSAFEQLVLETMSAEVMALPIIAFSFGTVPVLGLIANVLVGPFIPLAMLLTTIAGVVAMVVATSIVALPMMIVIGYMVAVVEWLSQLSFAQYELDIRLAVIMGWYFLIVVLCVLLRIKTRYNFRVQEKRIEL